MTPHHCCGSGSVILKYVSESLGTTVFIKDSKKYQKKFKYFIIFNDLLLVPTHLTTYFFNGNKNVPEGSGSGAERNN